MRIPLEYVRTDKNGTKYFHDYTCSRCGGAGGSDKWRETGWTCYECGGSGRRPFNHPQIVKEYTPEYRAKLDAAAAKRHEKRVAQARLENVAKQAEWKQNQGFVNDLIHVSTIKDTYSIKCQAKEAGGKYRFFGWIFSEPHEEFETIELTAEECLKENVYGNLDWRDDILDIIEAKHPSKVSDHVGQVGDKVELDVKYVRTGSYETRFGVTYVHTFEDADGNVFVWKTSSYGNFSNGENHVKATIKDHDEYNGVKQTILTRCKFS